jgi:excisionase family DNA binding protein
MSEPMSAALSARAAAARCGVSERTVRRWIAAGLLAADKTGGAFLVDLGAVRTVVDQRRGLAADSTAGAGVSAASNTEASDLADNGAAAGQTSAADTPQYLSELIQLVAQLHGEVSQAKDDAREHATAAAMWQERAGMLSDRLALAESKLAVLEAPQPENATLDAPGSTERPDPTTEPPGPWWRRWFAAVYG